jgi:hypothetical protein
MAKNLGFKKYVKYFQSKKEEKSKQLKLQTDEELGKKDQV